MARDLRGMEDALHLQLNLTYPAVAGAMAGMPNRACSKSRGTFLVADPVTKNYHWNRVSLGQRSNGRLESKTLGHSFVSIRRICRVADLALHVDEQKKKILVLILKITQGPGTSKLTGHQRAKDSGSHIRS